MTHSAFLSICSAALYRRKKKLEKVGLFYACAFMFDHTHTILLYLWKDLIIWVKKATTKESEGKGWKVKDWKLLFLPVWLDSLFLSQHNFNYRRFSGSHKKTHTHCFDSVNLFHPSRQLQLCRIVGWSGVDWLLMMPLKRSLNLRCRPLSTSRCPHPWMCSVTTDFSIIKHE